MPLYILPPPSAVFYQLFRNLPRIAEYTLVTGGETLRRASWSPSRSACRWRWSSPSRASCARPSIPLAVTLEMVPKIAFAPLFVTWFGFGYAPKVIIVFLVCFFPILLNGILAFTSLPTELGRLVPARPAPGRCAPSYVRLPAALPQLFVGIKGAAVNATVGATISEWIGGDAGPRLLHPDRHRRPAHGPRLRDHLRPGRAGPVPVLAPSTLVERWLIPWHISQRGQGRP